MGGNTSSYDSPKKIIDVGPRGNSDSFSVFNTGTELKFFTHEDKQIGKGSPVKDLSGNNLHVESVSHLKIIYRFNL